MKNGKLAHMLASRFLLACEMVNKLVNNAGYGSDVPLTGVQRETH
jgi:hypothetical protein